MNQMTTPHESERVGDVRAYFERAAGSFDQLYGEEAQSPFSRWMNRQFRSDIVGRFVFTCEHIKKSGARSVLDVGCGSGRYLAAFAKLGVERMVGIDLSQPMLDLSAKYIAAVGHTGTQLVRADFDTFLSEERFDVVVAMGYFDYQPDPVSVLRRMRGFGKNSVIASFPSRHWFRTPLRQIRYRLKNCPVYFYDSSFIDSIAAQAGFQSVATTKLPGAGMDYVSVFRVG